MQIKHGGKVAISSSRLPRATLGHTSAGLPAPSTPCTAKKVLCQVNAYGYDGHRLPLFEFKRVINV